MHTFDTTLVAGRKPPYHIWTFIVFPTAVAKSWGPGAHPIRGTLAGTPFRGTASRGEGVLRMPVPHQLRDSAGVARGDQVTMTVEIDPDPRPVEVPDELRAVFREHPGLEAEFARLPPAHQRAWARYVGEAKRPETRERRADAALTGIRERSFPK